MSLPARRQCPCGGLSLLSTGLPPWPPTPRSPGLHLCSFLYFSPASDCRSAQVSVLGPLLHAPSSRRDLAPLTLATPMSASPALTSLRTPGSPLRPPPGIATGVPNTARPSQRTAPPPARSPGPEPWRLPFSPSNTPHPTRGRICCLCLQNASWLWPHRGYPAPQDSIILWDHGGALRLTPRLTPLPHSSVPNA